MKMKITDIFKKERVQQDTPFNISSIAGTPKTLKNSINAVKGYAFAAMYKRAKLTASIGLYVATKDGENYNYNPNHIFQKVLEKPNMIFRNTLNELLMLTSLHLDWTGNCYWYVRNNGKQIFDIMLMPPSAKIIAGSDRYDKYFEFDFGGGKKYTVEGDQVVHFRTLGITARTDFQNNFYSGVPLLINSIADALQADESMLGYIFNFFENDAVPPVTLETSKDFDENDVSWLENFRRAWNQKFGIKNPPPVFSLPSNTKLSPLTNWKDGLNSSLVNGGLNKDIINRICVAFETPPSLLLNEYKFNNMEYVLQNYKRDVIEPILVNIEQTLTMFLKRFDENSIVTHDEVKVVNDDMKLKQLQVLISAGAITKNELRKEFSFDTTDEFDKIVSASSGVSADQEQDEPEQQEEKTVKKKLTEEILEKAWLRYDTPSEKQASNLKSIFKNIFDSLEVEIIKNLESKANKTLDDNVELFNTETWSAVITEATDQQLTKFLEGIIKLQLEDINIDYDEALTEYKTIIKQSIESVNSKMVEPLETIDKEIKKEIKKIVSDAPLDNDSTRLAKITEAVKGKMTIYKGARSEMIARTTSTASSEAAKKQVVELHGFKRYWVSSRDSKVRMNHARADGQKERAGKFTIGGYNCTYPADSSLPASEAINCRCRTIAQRENQAYFLGQKFEINTNNNRLKDGI